MSGADPWSSGAEPQGLEPEEAAANPIPPFLLEPWGIFRRRWVWMLAALLLGLAGTGAVVSAWKDRYEAEAKVVINSQQIPKEFVRSTVAESSMAYLNAAVGKALSRANLSQIIDEVGLYADSQGKVPRDALISQMRDQITVAPERSVSFGQVGESSIVYRLAFEGDDPAHAAAVANALAELLLKATLAQRSEQARSVTAFLKQALKADESELRAQSHEVSEFRRAHRGELPSDLETSLRKLDILEQRREDLSAEITRAQNRLKDLASAPSQQETDNAALLEQLRRQLAAQLAVHTEDHPNVIALRRQVKSFEEVVERERTEGSGNTQALASGQRDIDLMRKKLKEIDAEIDDLTKRVDRIPAVSEQLSALEQKEQVLREDYVASLRKVESAELAETLEVAQRGAQIEILERAQPPGSPKRPRWLVLVAGVTLSLGLGIGVGVLLELLDPVLLVASQLEQVVGRPVLGSLPHLHA